MGVATGMTAERMLAIEASSVVDGDVVGDNLVLTTRGGTTIDAGIVRGPQGLKGEPGNNANATAYTDQKLVEAKAYSDTGDAAILVAAKAYVDPVMKGSNLPSGTDLNNIIANGFYSNSSNAGAAAGANYPRPLAGLLEVHTNSDGTNIFVWQRYTIYGQYSPEVWTRTRYNGAWSIWAEPAPSGTLVQAGTPGIRVTDNPSSGVTTEFNICTVTITTPINGAIYRVRGKANLVPETAGSFSELRIRHGVGAQTGGTQITQDYVDHRIAARIVCGFTEGQFTYTGTTGATNYNVVMTCINTAGVRATATSTRTATLFVDRVAP